MNERVKREALKRTHAWWMCDNIIDHEGQLGLLYMGFPRLFILMRDYDTAYWAGYEEWKRDLIEVTFFEKEDREHTTPQELDSLLTDAWNFLALEEEEEERQAEERDKEEEW